MNIIKRLGPVRIQALKISGMGGIFWFAWAFSCYQTVYLQGKGFSASELGLLNAIASAVAIASVAFWGMISDKIGSLKRVLFIVLLGGAGLYGLIPLIPAGYWFSSFLFLTLLPAINFFRGSMAPLMENMQVRNCNEMRLNYGTIRGFGSLCFTVGSILVVALLSFLDVSATFWIAFLLMTPAIVLSFFIREPKSAARKAAKNAPKEQMNLSVLFKNKQYVSFLVFALIFYIAASCEGSFISYFMKSIDVPTTDIGIILAFRALLEIPFLVLMNRLRRRFKLEHLLMAGVLLISIEGLLFSLFASSLATMLVCTAFFGLGNGLFIGTSLNYVYQLAPANLKATAQSFFTAVASVAGIIGNLLGGLVFDAAGAKPFYFIVFLLYLLSVLVFLLSSFLWKKKQPTPVEAQTASQNS